VLAECAAVRAVVPVVVLFVGACAAPYEGDSPDPVAPDASAAGSDDNPARACTGLTTQPLDATWTVAGREVRVHVPATYDPTRATPVVLNLHGLASDGADQARISHLIATSDAHGFIAVHPNGTGSTRGWNGGDCCNPAASSGVDDTAWFGTLLDQLESKLCIDPPRVYALGFSNGAFMAHRLGCELADRIAAIGAVSGVIGIDTCHPARPVPVFDVHGTSDLVIPYGGGGVNNNESVATTIDRWASYNGCSTGATSVYEHGDATCVRRNGCTADVELCTIDGGGHQWPGGESVGVFNGTKSDDLMATDAAWAFFAAHPRP
jgi:polyhydroxybutyrate depolymerase